MPTAQETSMKTDRTDNTRASAAAHILVAAALAMSCGVALAASTPPTSAAPTSAAQKSAAAKRMYFASTQDAVDALVAALRAGDMKQTAKVLGPGHERILDSGDSAADRAAGQKFVADYDAKHGIVMEGDAKARLTTGATDWPSPIPLVKQAQGWTFDAVAGEREILARRIGRNELDTMQVCLAFVDMQREYSEADRNGDGILEYAARFISSPGKRDGLYWPTKEGEPQSPAGPRLAEADPQQVKSANGSVPYHGYYYRILTAQGKNAPGGARSYYANGKLIGGVALIAYPATYLNSGVKTFMCNMDAVVFEKDFGRDTAAKVKSIKAYDPDASWEKSKQ
jgi:hypothetical protein